MAANSAQDVYVDYHKRDMSRHYNPFPVVRASGADLCEEYSL